MGKCCSIFKKIHQFGYKSDSSFGSKEYKIMKVMFCCCYICRPKAEKVFKTFVDIQKGQTICDYGAGPGNYLKMASEIVGEEGKVYAVDIVPESIEDISNLKIPNVIPKLAKGYDSQIESDVCDVVYCLDCFHMVTDRTKFLSEIKRILKNDGTLYLSPGHQSMNEVKNDISTSKCFKINETFKRYLVLTPIINKQE